MNRKFPEPSKDSIKKREFAMNIKMFFNNEYLTEFDEQEMTFISSALARHCFAKLKLSERECQTFSADELLDISLSKYFLRSTINLCTIFEVWRDGDSRKKSVIEKIVDNSTKDFLQPYFDATGTHFEDDFQKALCRESAEIRLEFSTDTNEVIPNYKAFVSPAFIQYVLEQLPFVQLDEEVSATPRQVSELTKQEIQKIQNSPNVHRVKKLFEKIVDVGKKLVSLGGDILAAQLAASNK